MAFVPISIDKYVVRHLENNPSENEKDIRNRLSLALIDYNNGEKCTCGNDIWVIGSAAVGNSCFTCITGESHSSDDLEIESAIIKRENTKGRRHINDIDPTKLAGFFDDNGFEINTDLIEKPSLCIICRNDDKPNEEMLCNITRYDQRNEKEFKCFAFKKR
jgi:hypothetical protein